MNKKLLAWLPPVALLATIWMSPVPEGLSVAAWHMFAIFVATITGILTAPIAPGAMMMIAVALTYFTNTLPLSDALKGFSSGTVWMLFSAYVLSHGVVQSGLGRRLAYRLLSVFGGSSLGIAYSLGVADLIMAPAMPGVIARSGGIILPIIKSINHVMGSAPGPTGRRIGEFTVMTCFHYAPITGAMFMTGMAANPLCAQLAADNFGIELSWGGWFYAAVVPAMICFLLLPLLTYRLLDPELKKTPQAREMGRKELAAMGPMSRREISVAVGFVLAIIGWGTCLITGYSANAIGLALISFLFVTGGVQWKDVLEEKAAWDTVVWFGAILSLAGGLTKLGFVKWMSIGFSSLLTGLDWMSAFLILGFSYIYLHYMFATATGHVAAMYVPFAGVAIAAGAPAEMVLICFAIFSNFMWTITEYSGGPGPLFFGQGYFERPRFYRINFIVVTTFVIVVFATGMPWWKLIGMY